VLQLTGGSIEPCQIKARENRVASLEARIVELEQAIDSPAETTAVTKTTSMNTGASLIDRTLSTQSLVKAGLSEDMALEIMRRRNDLDLRKLQLHDRATREGYTGTPRYTSELMALRDEQISLRDELGDATYDNYLYANNRPNRVKVTSVMLGSVAEEMGVQDGDLILSYGPDRVFNSTELKAATSEGELGEYVNMDISRDGLLMSLWVPRGPLGVRLGVARVKP
jgi:C-terminal processing protease CtpA/Prc